MNKYDPFISAKLYCAYSEAVWFIAEYDPVDRIAYGYAMGLVEEDQWGHIWIDEMEECRFAGGFKAICADEAFVPCPFFNLST